MCVCMYMYVQQLHIYINPTAFPLSIILLINLLLTGVDCFLTMVLVLFVQSFVLVLNKIHFCRLEFPFYRLLGILMKNEVWRFNHGKIGFLYSSRYSTYSCAYVRLIADAYILAILATAIDMTTFK